MLWCNLFVWGVDSGFEFSLVLSITTRSAYLLLLSETAFPPHCEFFSLFGSLYWSWTWRQPFSSIWITLSLIWPGKFLMVFPGFNLWCSLPLFCMCPTIFLRHVRTVSLRMSCQWCLEFFSYLLNVCKFWILVARNDFRLRGKRPSVVDVMERVKSRVRIHLPLFFPSFPVWSPSSFLCSSVRTLSTGTRGTTTRYRMWSFSSVHAHGSHSNLSFAILGRQSVWLHVVGKRVQQGNN